MKDAISRELKLALALSPIAIPLGIVLVYFVLAVLMGSLGDAFTLILASIICTALISLIIWIPLWYIVGYGALLILRLALKPMGLDLGGLFAAKKTAPDKPPAQPAKVRPAAAPLSPQGLTNDQMALLNYVGKARRKGLTDAQISHNLEKNGWSGESVAAAFRMLKSGA